MPKSKNQQLKILYVAKYLLENSDENNSVSAEKIAEYIERTYGISAERRSVSRDINLLKYEFGMDIDGVKGSKNKVMSRDFNFRDLRIIAECIHSAKFVSAAKSKELVKNLTKLCSKYQAKILETDTILYDRAKTTQNGVIKTVEDINAAMSKSGSIPPRKISFKYLKYNINNVHQQIERRRGGLYKVSPYKLLISDGNYYLLAFADKEQAFRTYRVDRIKELKILDEPREGEEVFKDMDLTSYTRRTFGMYNGTEERVTMRFINKLLDTVVDRFGVGANAVYKSDDKNHFKVIADVAISNQFFGWICGFGNQVVIESPPNVVEQFKEYIEKIKSKY